MGHGIILDQILMKFSDFIWSRTSKFGKKHDLFVFLCPLCSLIILSSILCSHHRSRQDFCCVILGYSPYSSSSISLSNHHDPGKHKYNINSTTRFIQASLSKIQGLFKNFYRLSYCFQGLKTYIKY